MTAAKAEVFVGHIRKTTPDGVPSGEYGERERFICVDGLWYAESSIKAGARPYSIEQLSSWPFDPE